MNYSSVDLTVFIFYLAVMTVIGFWLALEEKQDSTEDICFVGYGKIYMLICWFLVKINFKII